MKVVNSFLCLMSIALVFASCGGDDCANPNPAYDPADPASSSCLDAPETGGALCVPGEAKACPCEGLYQECKEDGSGFTPCECPGLPAAREASGTQVEEQDLEGITGTESETEESPVESGAEGDGENVDEGGEFPDDEEVDPLPTEEGGESSEETGGEESTDEEGGGEGEMVGNCLEKSLDELKQDLLETFAAQVVASTYGQFSKAVGELSAAAQLWASTMDDADRKAAQQAWLNAMRIWQRAELFQVGPAASSLKAFGKDMRDYIYSFPFRNYCRIDQETVEGVVLEEAVQVTALGLDALDLLLFSEQMENNCSPDSSLNKNGTWEMFTDSELMQARAAYAVSLSILLVSRADELSTVWHVEFRPFLLSPGSDNPYFNNQQEALNAISDAFFYLETVVLNTKLAIPLGLKNCSAALCPEEEEVPFSGQSLHMVRENMAGLRMALMGVEADDITCETAGWVDLLVSVGAESTANDLIAKIDASIELIDALVSATNSSSIADLLFSDEKGVLAVHAAVQEVTTILKGEFLTVLNLQLPQSSAADND